MPAAQPSIDAWAAGTRARTALRRQQAPRLLAMAVLGLLHLALWKLITAFPSESAPPASRRAPEAATLRLLTEPRPPPASTSPSLRQPEPALARPSEMPARRAADAISWRPPAAGPTTDLGPPDPFATAPVEPAASAPLDLRLRTDPGSLRALMEAAPQTTNDPRDISVGGIADRDMGEGRRRIVIGGNCYDTRPSRATELGHTQSGLARDVQLVKPCH